MKVTLKKAFSILDGRLSTNMVDVYDMLNYIFNTSLYTHQLPEAQEILIRENPAWFSDGVSVIDEIIEIEGTDDFDQLMKAIDFGYKNFTIELERLWITRK